MKPGNLVHFVDCREVQYDTLGMVLGLIPSMHRDTSIRRRGLLKVVWYDEDCGVEDYDEEDLELVNEGWRFSKSEGQLP